MRRGVSLFLPTWSTDPVRGNLDNAAPPAEAPLGPLGRFGQTTDGASHACGGTARRLAPR